MTIYDKNPVIYIVYLINTETEKEALLRNKTVSFFLHFSSDHNPISGTKNFNEGFYFRLKQYQRKTKNNRYRKR